MNRLAILFILIFGASDLTSQTTFNTRERYDYLACILTSIIPTDSCYYATGIIIDTISPYNNGVIFLKLELDGSVQSIKTTTSSIKSYEFWTNSLSLLQDGGFMNAGYSRDSIYTGIIAKFDQFGDTLFVKNFSNPYYPAANFINPWGGGCVLSDGSVVVPFWIGTSTNPFGNDGNYYVVRTDSLGNKIWDKIFATSMWERPQSVLVTPDEKIIIGGIRTNENMTEMNYTFQCHIFQIDTSGNLEWEYTSPVSTGLRDAANDMVLLLDGSIVVASGVGHEEIHPSVNEVHFDKSIFKLNPQREIEWELSFPDSAVTAASRSVNLVQLSDGSGYVMSGMTYNAQLPPKYFTIRGWLAKISETGDSIWTRKYDYLTDGENEHKIYDLKETPDGGLILCGEAFDYSEESTYPQQGWLLKLDEHGCLVPGCHLSDASTEVQAPEIKLSIYPNPTTDFLNFYVHAPNPASGATFRIINAAGQLVKEFETANLGASFILPVWDWASGVYWLQYVEEGEVLLSEKFIKQ